ncbi:hypothetical protein M514_26341, partial [Trichuris suis]
MATAPEWAIISVYDKKGIVQLANALIQSSKVQVAASDGTYDHLINNGVPARKISSITGFSELLGGRVKTLHPSIFAGILADSTEEDMQQLRENGWRRVRFVVCNFYPFEETVSALGVTDNEVLANIDIGGVALLRAAAKNYQSVTVISDLSDYSLIINEITSLGSNDTTLETRQMLAVKAFQWTSFYDSLIADYMRITYLGQKASLSLRYGMNPHQNFARAFPSSPRAVQLPFAVLNGAPGFINMLDALNAWQLVSELRKTFNVPAAASFKHVSPAGAAIAGKLSDVESKVYMIDNVEHTTPLAVAYAKARVSNIIKRSFRFTCYPSPT